jgi:hypothetical protein
VALKATRVRDIGPQTSTAIVQRSVSIAVDACIAWTSSQQTGECLWRDHNILSGRTWLPGIADGNLGTP